MGDKEEEVSEVKEVVENGGVSTEKEGEAVVEKKDDATHGVKDMEEDTKDEEKVVTEMDVDNEETGELEKDDVKEDSVVKETKEDEEPKSEAVGEENGEKLEENEDKAESAFVDKETADKDAKKTVSKRKRGKEKPKAAEENTKSKKTVEKKKEEPMTPVAPASDRPVRERKSVERLVATIEKDTGKEFHIEKGRGTALKDIPNVAYKLSRKKSEETYKLLHSILFGRRGKATQVKSNISQFSGFVWHDNEDKQKNKIKEKLDKCVKEKLLEFCDVLDLPIAKATIRKEDIVSKLFEFLEAPQATTSELLADKEPSSKGNKRKRSSKKSTSTSGSAPSKSSAKSPRNVDASTGDEKKDTPETDNDHEEQEDEDVHGERENVDGNSDGSEDEKPERAQSEEKETKTGAESEEETKKRKRVSSKKSSVKKNTPEKVTPKKATTMKKSSLPPKKAPSRSSSSHSKVQDSDTNPKTFTRKLKKKTEAVKERSPTPKKSASKDIAGKKVPKGREKKTKVEKLKPSNTELKNAVCDLLKKVDFNTATFTDILKLLIEQFNTDLVPRKATIKLMIQDELTKLAEEEDDVEDEVEIVKHDKQALGAGVEV